MEKSKRGRKPYSEIRQRIVDILAYSGEALHGYEIYKIYRDIFGKVAIKSIYYNLHQGTKTGEIEIAEIRKEKGDFSWGSEAEKIYFKLGKEAKPRENFLIERYFKMKQS